MVRLLAVDATGLGHRAYHARRHEGGDGPFVTGAVVRMLASTWRYGPYDAFLLAFDHPENRRKDLFPGYKAHRPETAPELRAQLELLTQHLTEAGLPVAATSVGGIPDVVADGINGFLFAPGDRAMLEGLLRRLLHDAELGKRMALAARETVRMRFATERVLAQLYELYGELGLAGSAGARACTPAGKLREAA